MAEDLGAIRIVVEDDEKQVTKSRTDAGESGGAAMADSFAKRLQQAGQRLGQALGGGRGGRLGGFLGEAVGTAGGQAAGSRAGRGGIGRFLGSTFGRLTIAFAAVALGALAVSKVFKTLLRSAEALSLNITAQQTRLAGVSGFVATAAAFSLVRQLRRDVRTAGVVAPSLTRATIAREDFLDATSRINQQIDVIRNSIASTLFQALEPITDSVATVIEDFITNIQQKGPPDISKFIPAVGPLAPLVNILQSILDEIFKAGAQAKLQNVNQAYLADLERLTGGLFIPGVTGQPLAGPPAPGGAPPVGGSGP